MPGELQVSAPRANGIATYPPGASFGPRAMRDYELVWMIEGDATYAWGDDTADAPQGSVVLCRPGATDAFRWDPHRRTRHGYVHFTVDAAPPDWPPERAWPLVRSFADGDVVFPVFRHLLAWAEPGDRRLVRLSLAHLLTTFVTGQATTASVPRDALPEPVERALAHLYAALDADPSAPVPFADLVDASFVTGPHLCRLFKRETGHTPSETVRMARLDRAHDLVVRTNFAMKQIAQMTGFASPFHFSRTFAKAFGAAPARLREQVAKGETPPLTKLLRVWRGA